jgi:hypothetical protein
MERSSFLRKPRTHSDLAGLSRPPGSPRGPQFVTVPHGSTGRTLNRVASTARHPVRGPPGRTGSGAPPGRVRPAGQRARLSAPGVAAAWCPWSSSPDSIANMVSRANCLTSKLAQSSSSTGQLLDDSDTVFVPVCAGVGDRGPAACYQHATGPPAAAGTSGSRGPACCSKPCMSTVSENRA